MKDDVQVLVLQEYSSNQIRLLSTRQKQGGTFQMEQSAVYVHFDNNKDDLKIGFEFQMDSSFIEDHFTQIPGKQMKNKKYCLKFENQQKLQERTLPKEIG